MIIMGVFRRVARFVKIGANNKNRGSYCRGFCVNRESGFLRPPEVSGMAFRKDSPLKLCAGLEALNAGAGFDYPLIPVEAMPSTKDFWKMRKMTVAGTMDRVDMASVEPISEPEEGSLNSCRARETGRMLARFT